MPIRMPAADTVAAVSTDAAPAEIASPDALVVAAVEIDAVPTWILTPAAATVAAAETLPAPFAIAIPAALVVAAVASVPAPPNIFCPVALVVAAVARVAAPSRTAAVFQIELSSEYESASIELDHMSSWSRLGPTMSAIGYAAVIVMPPAAILKMSLVAIAFDALRAPWNSKLPLVAASWIPKCVQVPHEAPAAGKSTTAALSIVPPDAASQVIAWRA